MASSNAGSGPDLELMQALAELRLKQVDSTQKIALMDSQIVTLKRSMLRKEITNREMANLPQTTPVYEEMGRCFFASTIPEVRKNLGAAVKDFAERIKGLENGKDLLEKDYNSTKNSVDELVRSKQK